MCAPSLCSLCVCNVCLCTQLTGGQLVVINAKLVKKQRFHFTTLPGLDVDIIAGLNGLIWVSPHVERAEDGAPLQQQQQQQQPQQQQGGEVIDSAAAVAAAAAAAQGPSKQQREAVVRVAGAIRALAALMLQVYPGSITEAYQVGRGAEGCGWPGGVKMYWLLRTSRAKQEAVGWGQLSWCAGLLSRCLQ